MSSEYFLNCSTIRNEVVDGKLNCYVTQKEFKNLTGNVDSSGFALKTNLAQIKVKLDEFNKNDITNLQL